MDPTDTDWLPLMPDPGPLSDFAAALVALGAHLKECDGCRLCFEVLDGDGMLCDDGRRLANAVDATVGMPPRF